MKQNFSKGKILHESSELEHCQWGRGGDKNSGTTNLRGGGGVKNFGSLKRLDFQQLSYW